VARAKRTDRAEARRKYRAYLQAQEDAAIEAEAPESSAAKAGAKPARPRFQESPSGAQPQVRLGLLAAARAAYRTPHYIDDIKSIRQLIFSSHAVWPIVIICAISGVYSISRLRAPGYATDPILPILFQFVFYPPLIPPMLAGFLAPRATWLAGLIASLLATITLIAVIGISDVKLTDASGAASSASPSKSPAASLVSQASASGSVLETSTPAPTASGSAAPTDTSSATVAASVAASAGAAGSPSASPSAATATTTGTSAVNDLFTYAWVLLLQSLTIGALIGGLSGWYKRFLALSGGGPRKPSSSSRSQRSSRRPASRR
jgi:hypothetical protein